MFVAVAVDVAVAVIVGVLVAVGVEVIVGVSEGVKVGVAVAVTVGVAVGNPIIPKSKKSSSSLAVPVLKAGLKLRPVRTGSIV